MTSHLWMLLFSLAPSFSPSHPPALPPLPCLLPFPFPSPSSSIIASSYHLPSHHFLPPLLPLAPHSHHPPIISLPSLSLIPLSLPPSPLQTKNLRKQVIQFFKEYESLTDEVCIDRFFILIAKFMSYDVEEFKRCAVEVRALGC